MSQRMVEVQKLEAKLRTKIRAKRWQAFMKSLNLLSFMIHVLMFMFITISIFTCMFFRAKITENGLLVMGIKR